MNIHEIRKELGLKKLPEPNYGVMYEGVLVAAEFDGLYCYGAGILTVSVYRLNPLIPTPLITITTVDDGVWAAHADKEVDVEDLVKNFTAKFGILLPSERVLNEFLRKYGAYGTNEG